MSTAFQAALREKVKNDSAYHVDRLRQNKVGRDIVERLLRSMPRSLGDYFRVSYFSCYGGEYSLSSITLHFRPIGSLRDERRHRIALGTIDKVVAALAANGWSPQGSPEPKAIQHEPRRMNITVSAKKDIPLPNGTRRGLRGLRRMMIVPQEVTLELTFGEMPENDRCRLVEREVIIPAEPEHIKRQMVVACDEEEPAS